MVKVIILFSELINKSNTIFFFKMQTHEHRWLSIISLLFKPNKDRNKMWIYPPPHLFMRQILVHSKFCFYQCCTYNVQIEGLDMEYQNCWKYIFGNYQKIYNFHLQMAGTALKNLICKYWLSFEEISIQVLYPSDTNLAITS